MGKKNLNRHFSKEDIQWLTNTWKDAQHGSLLEKCKSKLQWGITSHQSEWPSTKNLQTISVSEWSSSKNLQTISAVGGADKREPSCTISGNVNWHSHYGEQYESFLEN